MVGVGGRVVADGVEVSEVIANGGEGLLFILPILGEVGLPPVALLMRSKTAVEMAPARLPGC